MFTAAMIAVLTAALTFIVAQVSDVIRHRRDRKLALKDRDDARRVRREALLIAFFGEIQTLDNFLNMEAERACKCLEADIPLEIRAFRVPRDVFAANTSCLGELGDSTLVANLVTLYAMVEDTNTRAARLEGKGEHSVESMLYLRGLSSCLGFAVHVHARLEGNTAKFRDVPDQVDQSKLKRSHREHLNAAERLEQEASSRLQVRTDLPRPPRP